MFGGRRPAVGQVLADSRPLIMFCGRRLVWRSVLQWVQRSFGAPSAVGGGLAVSGAIGRRPIMFGELRLAARRQWIFQSI